METDEAKVELGARGVSDGVIGSGGKLSRSEVEEDAEKEGVRPEDDETTKDEETNAGESSGTREVEISESSEQFGLVVCNLFLVKSPPDVRRMDGELGDVSFSLN